jgi:polyisoprenoid-binding protein YceI
MSSSVTSGYATSTSASPSSAAAVQAWDVDPAHSSAHFKVRHLMVSHVRGELGPISGAVWIDDQDVTRSRIEVSIDASKIATRDEKRDEHLRSADFLDVANHPTVSFKSTRVERAGGDELRVTGDLTIHGTTRPVTLTVESLAPAVADPWGNTKRGAAARTKINRKDWGLQWNVGLEAGGVLVGEEVAIEIEVELVKRK